MARVHRTGSRVAWGIKRQSAFGTPMAKTDLTKFLKLSDPLIIQDAAEHWTDRGMIGLTHEWETQRGITRQMVRIEIPSQPMPIDFAGYLLAQFFSTSAAVDNTGSYTHTAKWTALSSLPNAYVFSLAIDEDGVDQCVQDLVVTDLTISGSGDERMMMGATLLGSKLATPLDTYTWPTAVAANYAYNYAGAFTIAAANILTQLRNFELTLSSGISLDQAFMKAATEAARIYPQIWRYTPDRTMSLKLGVQAESGNLATFRAAQKAGTENAVVVSCVGEQIGSSGEYWTVAITVPKAVYNTVEESYTDGLEHIDLTIDGHYDSTTGGPISIATTTDIAAYLVAA